MTRRTCKLAGCGARVHGHGLCRRHYDLERYRESTASSFEAVQAAEREGAIRSELQSGAVAERRSPHGTGSMFATDSERREAWEARHEELVEPYLTPPLLPGRRPAAWWEYEAGRPEHLTEDPDFGSGPEDEEADAIDAYEIEPVEWMAAHGHLTDDELAVIELEASEARPRVGTDDEHIGSGGVDRVNRRAVKLHEAVRRALRD